MARPEGTGKLKAPVKWAEKRLNLDRITADERLQMREVTDEEYVREMADVMKSGEKLDGSPPKVIFDGRIYWLCDGFHRLAAAKIAKKPSILVDWKHGTYEDALLEALKANSKHGKRRTNADMRRAVLSCLDHPIHRKLSARKIAELCCVSHTLVNDLKKERAAPAKPPEPAGTDDDYVDPFDGFRDGETSSGGPAENVKANPQKVEAASTVDDEDEDAEAPKQAKKPKVEKVEPKAKPVDTPPPKAVDGLPLKKLPKHVVKRLKEAKAAFASLHTLLKAARESAKALMSSPGGAYVTKLDTDLTHHIDYLGNAEPVRICPKCEAAAPVCNMCGNTGVISRHVYTRLLKAQFKVICDAYDYSEVDDVDS